MRSALVVVILVLAGSACEHEHSIADAPVATASTTTTTSTTNEPDLLWGRAFVSQSITSGGVPVAIYDKVTVTVRFEQRATGGVIQWHADCNFMGGSVAFDREHMTLSLSEAGGTAIGCATDPGARDRWINEFVLAGPRWWLDGDALILATKDSAITLVPA